MRRVGDDASVGILRGGVDLVFERGARLCVKGRFVLVVGQMLRWGG